MTRRRHRDGHTSHGAAVHLPLSPRVCPSSPATHRRTGDQAPGCDALPMTPPPPPPPPPVSSFPFPPSWQRGPRRGSPWEVGAGAYPGTGRPGCARGRRRFPCRRAGSFRSPCPTRRSYSHPGLEGRPRRGRGEFQGGRARLSSSMAPTWRGLGGERLLQPRTPTWCSPFPKAVPRPIDYGCTRDSPPPPGLGNTHHSIQDAPRDPEWSRNGAVAPTAGETGHRRVREEGSIPSTVTLEGSPEPWEPGQRE